MSIPADAWHTLVPRASDPHGALPPMLVALTCVTGLVDSYSYLELGRVFVANMTGNVVFLGFAVGGAPGFIWWASLLAILCFVAGALVAGQLAHLPRERPEHLLVMGSSTQFLCVVVALIATLVVPPSSAPTTMIVPIIMLALAMGLQNQIARALAVTDLTTTVLTLTITGIAADSRLVGGAGSHAGRRFVAIAAMFLGALVGAMIIQAGHPPVVLVIAAVFLAGVVIAAWILDRSKRLTNTPRQ